MNTHKFTDFALHQLDNAGFFLSQHGITQDLNRHTLIARAMTGKTRLEAEWSRLEFKTRLRRYQLKHTGNEWLTEAEHWLDKAPFQLGNRVNPRLEKLRGLLH